MKKATQIFMIIVAVTISTVYTAKAQVSVNTYGSNSNASAMLDVKSSNKGFLPPRVATVNNVSNPVAGLQVYDQSNKCMRYYNGTEWSKCMGGEHTCGNDFVDSRDGKSYSTVQIGTQCWMAENLNIGTSIGSSNAQTDNNTIEKYCYNNNASNCDTYGGLYQWDEAMGYVTTVGTQGICPTGWHLPTDDEFKTMEMSLGMTAAQANGTGYRGTNEGSKLAGNAFFWDNGSLESNSAFGTSGFMAFPVGLWNKNNNFQGIQKRTSFWSSNQDNSKAWRRLLVNTEPRVYRESYDKLFGYSVRCLRD